MNIINKVDLLKELEKRHLHEIEYPTGYVYGDYPGSAGTYQVSNKSKLKRLRLLIAEVMKELEEEMK